MLLEIHDDGRRRPVYYASRSLTETEKRYTVIEKEALAATWACEKFREYVMGLSFTLETDHKPVVPLLKTTELAKMSPRIQRFRMRLMRYSPEVAYVPGKKQTTPDALSRAPVNIPEKTDVMFLEEVEHVMVTQSHVTRRLYLSRLPLRPVGSGRHVALAPSCRIVIFGRCHKMGR